jgi:hypothetical protein
MDTLARVLDASVGNLSERLSDLEVADFWLPSENKLVNPGFERAQRGAGPYTANGVYTMDRWQLLHPALAAVSVSQDTTVADIRSTASARINFTHAVGHYAHLVQELETARLYSSSLVSFSVRVRADVLGVVRPYLSYDDNATRELGDYNILVGEFETLTISIDVPAVPTGVWVGVEVRNATSVVYVDNACAVLGFGPVEYKPLHPADDITRSRRHYQSLHVYHTWVSQGAGEIARVRVAYANPMSGTPTTSITAGSRTNITSAAVGSKTPQELEYVMTATAAGIARITDDTLVLEHNP